MEKRIFVSLLFVILFVFSVFGQANEPVIIDLKDVITESGDDGSKTIKLENLVVGKAYRIMLYDRDRTSSANETGLVDMLIFRADGFTTEGYEGPSCDGAWYSSHEPAVFITAQDTTVELWLYSARPQYVGTFSIKVTETNSSNVFSIQKETIQGVSSVLVGTETNRRTNSRYGLALTGGVTFTKEARDWMLNRAGNGGNFIFITSKDNGAWDYIYGFDSSRTLAVLSREDANTDFVYNSIMNASAVYFDGGDQSKYVEWYKGTRLEQAINYVARWKKIPIGGKSAGLAIMGRYVYSAMHSYDLRGYEALENPYSEYITIEDNFLKLPFMENVFTDTHFTERDRQGRLITFIGRIMSDWRFWRNRNVIGVGVDESTTLAIEDNGDISVFGKGAAHIYLPVTTPETFVADQAVEWNRSGLAIKYIALQGTDQPSGVNWNRIRSYPNFGWIYVTDGEETLVPFEE